MTAEKRIDDLEKENKRLYDFSVFLTNSSVLSTFIDKYVVVLL